MKPEDLLQALRYRGDERQLGRMLAVACQDPAVSKAFVHAALAHRCVTPGRRKAQLAVPDDLLCQDEARLTAGLSKRRVRDYGRADLLFTSRRFRLVVELKINDRLERDQIRGYVNEGSRVLAIGRDPEQILSAVGEPGPGWLGAAAWEELVEPLRDLPIANRTARRLWRRFIRNCEEGGDFDRRQARAPGIAAARETLEAVAPDVLVHLQGRLGRKYSRGFAQAVTVANKASTRRSVAQVDFDLEGEIALRLRLRGADTASPVLQVDWFPPESGLRDLRESHRQLLESKSKRWIRRRSQQPAFRHEARLPDRHRGEAVERRVLTEATARADQLVRAGVFRWDAAQH